jgi:hypothetical protein
MSRVSKSSADARYLRSDAATIESVRNALLEQEKRYVCDWLGVTDEELVVEREKFMKEKKKRSS